MTDENDAAVIATLQEPLISPYPRHVQPSEESNSETTTEALLATPDDTADTLDHHLIVDGLTWERSILVKSLYFLDALGSSTWGRFSAIYYNIHGLNSQQIGMIEGLRTAIPTLSMVLWGVVSDRWQCRKQVWVVTKTASTCVLLLLALPQVFRYFRRILGKTKTYLACLEGLCDIHTDDLKLLHTSAISPTLLTLLLC